MSTGLMLTNFEVPELYFQRIVLQGLNVTQWAPPQGLYVAMVGKTVGLY